MKKRVNLRKKYYDLYSCGNFTCIILCNRMMNEKMQKKLLFSFVKYWAEEFLPFTYTFEEMLKKGFQSFKKVTYALVITIFEILFKLAFKDFPGRRRAKCTKLSRCCFHQCFCKAKFIIFFQEFCPRNKLFWKWFP